MIKSVDYLIGKNKGTEGDAVGYIGLKFKCDLTLNPNISRFPKKTKWKTNHRVSHCQAWINSTNIITARVAAFSSFLQLLPLLRVVYREFGAHFGHNKARMDFSLAFG